MQYSHVASAFEPEEPITWTGLNLWHSNNLKYGCMVNSSQFRQFTFTVTFALADPFGTVPYVCFVLGPVL